MSVLTPVKKIAVQDWMQDACVIRVMEALNAHGLSLFVGGCVRNMLLGEEVGDVDIASTLEPEQVIAALDEAGIKHVPTGIEHGTVTAVVDGRGFEVTSLRKDVETDGRRAVVSFTKDWAVDATRRDFTMNTLLTDLDGQVFDPTGLGLADLEARRVVFVGEAEQRIREDYLRILRFFRFFALYGKGKPDETALKACEAQADGLVGLSKERVTQEFFKILSAEKPAEILSLMFSHGVLKEFEFGNAALQMLGWVSDFQARYELRFVASRILVLADLKLENVETILERLILPKVFVKDIQAICGVLAMADLDKDHATKEAIYRYGRVASAQALMIELANDRVMNGDAPEILKLIQNWDVPNFPVSGDDLLKAGYKPGPNIGAKLNELENRWVSEGFEGDKKSLLGN